ncbi:carbohydrate-binding protein [Stutzerimonas kunmingensis]|uniref:carbohydrate-binding protein n=1 Tax=Stutzerimonas kunmingensis TaxID=1211807 RepID=UPI00241FF787|nr:carbohydrate-binding protein [Stutzerimonas kunmingensis]
MRIIKPVEITPAILTSSNVPETDYAAWSAATAYAVGDRAMYNHRNYEALVAHTGANPETDTSDPPKWLDLGATNRWRMFDDRVGSLTEKTGSIAVELQPGAVINSVALFNLLGRSATVTLTDPSEGVVYQRTVSLVDAGVSNWYDYFFAPIGRQTDFVLLDLPAYGTATLSVTIDNASDTASVGHLVMGRQAELGVAVYGSGVGITDYSRKETDAFGNSVVVERSFSKRAEFDVVVETPQIGRVQRLLASLRAQPVVWIGAEGYESTFLFGYYRDFQISISGPSVSDASITVEGLT